MLNNLGFERRLNGKKEIIKDALLNRKFGLYQNNDFWKFLMETCM